jgi:hypothetical protein
LSNSEKKLAKLQDRSTNSYREGEGGGEGE